MSPEEPIEFFADHPFTYVLVHQKDLPLFWGSVVRLEENTFASSEHDELWWYLILWQNNKDSYLFTMEIKHLSEALG